MADVGRKSKYETHIKPHFEQIDKWLNGGASEKQCAKSLGISYATWNNYKNQHEDFKALCEKPRQNLVDDLRSALVKKALGFEYEETEEYVKQEVVKDPITNKYVPVGNPVMHRRTVTKQALPDTTAIFGALNLYDEEYVKDKKQYELKQQELELRKMIADSKDW